MAGVGLDLAASLARLLPGLDWAFLRERARKRSEKALENDRQAQPDDEGNGSEDEGPSAAGREAVAAAAAPPAAPPVPPPPGPSARERALAAAERRQAQQGELAAVCGGQARAAAPSTSLATDSAPLGQRAAAATKSASVLAAGGDAAAVYEEEGAGSLAAVVGGAWAAIFNAQPRLLLASGAAASSSSASGSSLGRALVAALADETEPAALAARLRAATANAAPATSAPAAPADAEVEAWVLAARDFEGSRALRAIVAGGGHANAASKALVAQLALVKVRTVRDLALWAKRPALLRRAMAKHATQVELPDDAAMVEWAVAAQAAMAARPWIEAWATRV